MGEIVRLESLYCQMYYDSLDENYCLKVEIMVFIKYIEYKINHISGLLA